MGKPLIIGVTGGSGSGKTYFLKELLKDFSDEEICLISQDNYYKPRDEQPVDEKGVRNFDLPESIEHERFYNDILTIKSGKEVRLLEYTYNNPDVTPRELIFKPASVIIVEGIMVFYWEKIRKLIDISVFIDAKDLIKIKRRIIRDAQERGYDLNDVLYRYEHHVMPFYNKILKPLKDEVDIIIPNNSDFRGGLIVMKGFIRDFLDRN